jgi:L-lysine 6-monooxygenase (NADPH-requiring)
MRRASTANKRVVIVGGGQSGAEIFLELARCSGARAPCSLEWVSSRANFLPLDDSPFVNEYFVPGYSRHFRQLPAAVCKSIMLQREVCRLSEAPAFVSWPGAGSGAHASVRSEAVSAEGGASMAYEQRRSEYLVSCDRALLDAEAVRQMLAPVRTLFAASGWTGADRLRTRDDRLRDARLSVGCLRDEATPGAGTRALAGRGRSATSGLEECRWMAACDASCAQVVSKTGIRSGERSCAAHVPDRGRAQWCIGCG